MKKKKSATSETTQTGVREVREISAETLFGFNDFNVINDTSYVDFFTYDHIKMSKLIRLEGGLDNLESLPCENEEKSAEPYPSSPFLSGENDLLIVKLILYDMDP